MDAFNRALDEQKGGRTEAAFAAEDFGVTDETLRAYRRLQFPKGMQRLLGYPKLVEAYLADLRNGLVLDPPEPQLVSDDPGA